MTHEGAKFEQFVFVECACFYLFLVFFRLFFAKGGGSERGRHEHFEKQKAKFYSDSSAKVNLISFSYQMYAQQNIPNAFIFR